MTLRPLILAAVFGLFPVIAVHGAAAETTVAPMTPRAGDTSRIAALTDVMMMDQVMAVMRDEGLDYGSTLEEEMFAGRGGARWKSVVAGIYDPARMRRNFDAALTKELADAGGDLSQIEAFFGSARGQRALTLEIDARRALLDPDTEDAAKVTWADMAGGDTKRAGLIRAFAEANDLVESNVAGALNANLAFYRGLAESGSFPEDMTEEQMLSDVWEQEPQIRSETESWIFPFLALSYQPLSDSDLEAYIAFSQSAAGKRMNAAMFAAFDVVFSQISQDLGRAAADQMKGEDI